MLKDLGLDIPFVNNPVTIGIDDQSIQLISKESLAQYIAMLTNIFPQEALGLQQIQREIKNVMAYMDVIYGIDNPMFLQKVEPAYLVKTLLPWLFKYQINIRKASKLNQPVTDYLKRFTPNQALIDMITQHFFRNTPAFFALSYFSLYLDYWYPTEGTGMLASCMTKYIQTAGGLVKTGVGVCQLDAHNHQVHLDSGEVLSYQKLIWAADQKTLYRVAKGVDAPAFQRQCALLKNSRGNDSILTFYLGVDLAPDYFESRCGAHMFYTPGKRGISSLPDWKQVAQLDGDGLLLWLSDYLETTTFEISCPALRNIALAPKGKTGLIISTLMDYTFVKHLSDIGKYQQLKALATERILSIFERHLFPGISKKVLFSLCSTPLTLEKETSNFEGAITGWSFTNPTMPCESRFRFMKKSIETAIPDIYQCGQWTFSPSGLPVSILTGKLAADQVHVSLKAVS